MPKRGSAASSRGARAVGVLLAAGLLVAPAASTVHADPGIIAEVRSQLQELERASAAAAERVNGAKAVLARSQERLAVFSRQVTASRVELASQQRNLEGMAWQLYVDGVSGSPTLTFALDDPSQFLADLDRLAAATSNQSTVVAKAREQAMSLKVSADALEREQQRLSDATEQLGVLQAEADERVAEARALLASLEEQERQRLIAEAEAERERERAEAAALLAARQAAAASNPPTVGSTGVDPLSRPDQPGSSPPANRTEAVTRAVNFALSKVGGPYVWGASGPTAYDCSGLTQAAWAQSGVALTHYSGTQYAETQPVRFDDLQAGDLLYFYSIHQHVGMYIGDGRFVHAANPLDGIRLDSLNDYYRDNLVAASRPAA